MKSEADLFPGLVLSSAKGSHLLHPKPRGQGTFALQHHALENMYIVKKLKYFFSDCHLHFVDSAPVLGVLSLSVAGVDDLLVVVEKLLADRTLGVQVLGEVFWSKSSFFNVFQVSPGRWPWQGCPSPAHPRSEKKDINKRSRTKMSAIL